MRLVGEVAGLNGMEEQPKGAHQKSNILWAIGGGKLQSTIATTSTAGGISLSPNSNIRSFE